MFKFIVFTSLLVYIISGEASAELDPTDADGPGKTDDIQFPWPLDDGPLLPPREKRCGSGSKKQPPADQVKVPVT